MKSTTIKVPVELRDRLAARATANRISLAAAITQSLDAADEAEFWTAVATTMGATHAGRDAEAVAQTLTDGLDPAEDWSDVW